EQKMALGYQNPFYLNQAQQKQQSLYNGKVLLEKHDPPIVYDLEETLQLAQESRLKMKQLNKEIKLANYAKINQLSGVFVSQKAKSREELYFLNTSKMATVSKSISIPNEEFSNDTSPSVAQKFLNEQLNFFRDIKSLAKEADESLAKHKALEFEIERLLRAVVSQDIMSIVQRNSVIDTSNLQTKLDRTKEKLKNCIIKKEKEYVIERLQAQLGDLKHKSKDTPCESDTLDSLSQKLENENVELEFQVLYNAKENAHLKTTYKNLFDSINVTRAQTKTTTNSSQQKLRDTKYENAKLRAQLFDKVSEQKDITKGKSVNTMFANQSPERKPSLQSLRNNFVVRQPNAFQSGRQKFSKTRDPQKVDETNDLSNPVTSNSNDKSKVICAMCYQCLITSNHDVCVLKYVNDIDSRVSNLYDNGSKTTNRKKHKPKVTKPKKVGSKERLTSPKPRNPRTYLRWSPTRRMFDLKGQIIESSESESPSDCFKGDNASTSNPQEPTRKWFPNSTFSLLGRPNLFMVRRLGVLKTYDRKSEASNKLCLEVLRNRPLWK
ncbi:hypothetical protein Tco_0957954, partial [Tanacetum coccineum]